MNKKYIGLVLGLAILAVAGFMVFSQEPDEDDYVVDVATTTPTTAMGSYTMADISAHKDATSCWSAINGGVYDLTAWVPKHPGGERAILQLCGTDGSAKFNGQHGGAALQARVLAGYKIGTLK